MLRKAFLLLVVFFLFTASVWAGRYGSPNNSNYNPQMDSYIVIEGTISGLPSQCIYARPHLGIPFLNLPSDCQLIYTLVDQTLNRDYYCRYVIFKDTATKRSCWHYFRNLTSVSVTGIRIKIKRSLESKEENWVANLWARVYSL